MSIKRQVRKHVVSLAIVGTVMAGLATVVIATPGSGAVGTIMARAAFTDSVDIKIKLRDEREVIHVPHAQDTVMQQIVIAPGGHTGWHSHPGPAIALVKSGELTLYSSEDPTCTGRPFGVGQGFVDSGQGHVHIARNLTAQPTEVWVTYLDVPPGGSVRIDVPNPGNCNF
jgi:hypothetical protein